LDIRGVVTGEWRNLHEGEHHLEPSPNIKVLKSRTVRHVACTEATNNSYKILVGKSVGRNHLGENHTYYGG